MANRGLSPIVEEGEKAKKGIEESVTSTGLRKPGPKSLHVLRENKGRAALLLEAGFITNGNDVAAIQGDGKGNVPLAKEVAAGINSAVKE